MVSPNVPIINAGNLYVQGLKMVWQLSTPTLAAPTITLFPGACRDSKNVNDIILQSPVTLVVNKYGANGVDVNGFDPAAPFSLFPLSFYGVYLIGDSNDYQPSAVFISLAPGAANANPSINLPSGYDMYRRVGWIKTDSTGNSRSIFSFVQYGASDERDYWWTLQQQIVSGAVPTTFTAITTNNTSPPISNEVLVNVAYTPANPANFMSFLPFSAPASAVSGAEGSILYGIGSASNTDYGQLTLTVSLNAASPALPSFYYRSSSTGDSAIIATAGYKDYL